MIAVVIPTFNEEASIGPVVSAIPRDLVSRIIVADSGSSNATAARAREAGAEVLEVGRGYGRACLAAAVAADDADFSSSWTATAPTIRQRSRRWSRRSAPALATS
jgi:glycosyltransferase involved in cell wall biosynthesis